MKIMNGLLFMPSRIDVPVTNHLAAVGDVETLTYVMENSRYGYWKYIENEEVVVISEYIKGYNITSYCRIFAEDYGDKRTSYPKKIISTSKNIESMEVLLCKMLEVSDFFTILTK